MKYYEEPGGKRKTLALNVTNHCNLSCVYCYENNKSNKHMRLDVAKKAIRNAFSSLAPDEELEIDFHGGEPFVAFNLIQKLCDWLWSQDWPAPYICFATTNGTLIKGKIKEWADLNSERFWLGLSLDGNRKMHNMNRSNSFDDIDILFFRDKWPLQPVKMTISNDTLPLLAEGVIYLHDCGFEVSWNLAFGIDWSNPSLAKEYSKQLKLLADFYIENKKFKPSGPFEMKIDALSYDDIEPQKWCGTGTHMVAIDIAGNEYPCQMFLPTVADNKPDDIDWEDPSEFIDENCIGCSIYAICATCYGKNWAERGSISLRDMSLCNMFKLQALASSYLNANLLLEYGAEFKDLSEASDVYEQIRAINVAQNKIYFDLKDNEIFI